MRWRGSTATIMAATVGMVLASACSAGSGNGAGTGQSPDPSSGPTAPSQPPSPAALSIQEYTTRITRALNPVDAALDKLADAKGYKGLEKRVTGVGSAATKAASALAPLLPPAELVEPHARLVTALEGFDEEVDSVGAKVDARSLCTGSVVRAGLGDADETSALRKAVDSVDDLLPGKQRTLSLPAADRGGDGRPSTGTYVHDVNRNASAYLEIDNGGSADAVVTLTKGNNPDISVYLRRGGKHRVRGVPDGSYQVFFAGGGAWDRSAKAFGKNCRFQKFADPLTFRTTRNAGGTSWQNFTITLNPVVGGNARTNEVDPDSFPE